MRSIRLLQLCRISLLALLSCAGVAHGETRLRFAVVDTWPMPIAQYSKNGTVTGGFIRDLAIALSRELGATPQFVLVSRNRADIALDHGWADIRCYVSRKWVADRNAYDWSGELFEVRNLLVWRKGSPALAALSDLHGANIGATLGYRYPALEPVFEHGLAKRDDAPGTEVALHKLLMKRNDYTVVDNLVLAYFIHHDPQGSRLSAQGLELNRDSIECAIARSPALDADKVVAAFDHLRQRGAFSRMLDKLQN